MKKRLELMLLNLNLKNVSLSGKQKYVFGEWKEHNNKTEKDFYKSLLKITMGHEKQYKTREKCAKKGHNEEIKEVSMEYIYTHCKKCDGYFTRSINDSRFVEDQYSFADYDIL